MLEVGAELDLLEADGAGKEHVHELTVGGTAAHLLDLGQLRVQAVVHPGQHLVSEQTTVKRWNLGRNRGVSVPCFCSFLYCREWALLKSANSNCLLLARCCHFAQSASSQEHECV